METGHSDILILGAGCAGLTAAIYAARSGRKTTVLEKGIPGGQAALTARIDNYPGIPGIDGLTLMQEMTFQAKCFGAEIISCDVNSADLLHRKVETAKGTFSADAMILATGAEPRRLGIPGEKEFAGRGVSYCASCDGWFYRDRDIYVVGGGNSAGEEALHLAEIGSRVFMIVRRGEFRCDAAIAEQVLHHPRIEVLFHRELVQIRGDDKIRFLTLKDTQSGIVREIPADGCGVFLFVGYRPASDLFRGQLALDADGAILTDDHLMTGVPGVFAAGDVRQKPLRQIVTATGDGALAAFHACKLCGNMLS